MRDDVAIFILSHERASKQHTLDNLLQNGYTGRWYIVIDDTDPQLNQYMERYGDHVIIFDKQEVYGKTDTLTSRRMMKCAVYARNMIEELARDMELKAYCAMDDDLREFRYRYIDSGKLKSRRIKNVAPVIESYFDYLLTANISCLSFGNESMYVGGSPSVLGRVFRKGCATFFRNVSRPMKWIGCFNEDVITSVAEGIRGNVILSHPQVSITAVKTGGKATGGAQLSYQTLGEYERSFYGVLVSPTVNSVVISKKKTRLENGVSNRLPEIISERWRKGNA